MAGKRKREITPLSPAKFPVATAPTPDPSTDSGNRDNKRRKADDVMVVWQLADGSGRFQRKLGESHCLSRLRSLLQRKPHLHTFGRAVFAVSDALDRADGLGKDKTLNDAIYKMVKKLDISTPGNIRLAQVREGGREVEILDGEFLYTLHLT